MKVLHVINDLSSGGAEKLVEEISIIMSTFKNVEVEVLLLEKNNNVFGKLLEDSFIPVGVVPLKKMRNPLNIYFIYKHIKKGDYDIVHSHLFPDKYWVAIVSRLYKNKKTKFVTTEHSTNNKRRNVNLLKPVEKFIYSSYDKIISISRNTQENLLEWLEFGDSGKFCVIENGIDVNFFKTAKQYKKKYLIENLNDQTILLCMVGRFSQQKDQLTLIKAMKYIHYDVRLILVGEGNRKEENEQYANDIGVESKVCFLGFRRDIDRILKTVDIVVLSSHWEGFGLAAVEGMAAGKPVIGTNVDGLKEVIGCENMLFDVGNARELADIINMLIKDKSFYQQKVKDSLYTCEKYDIENMVDKYIEIYLNISK